MIKTLLAVCAVAVTAIAAPAEESNTPNAPSTPTASPVAPAGAPFVNWSPFQELPKWLHVSGQIRGRLELPSGTALTNTTSGDYFLSRIRLDLGIKPTPWMRFFVQSQDARVAGYQASPAPSTIFNPIDLRQGYVELGGEVVHGVTLRVGRQELAFGGERLIGPADWGMSRTFDSVDLSFAKGKTRLDVFAGSAVTIDPNRFDRHKAGEHFYGAYGSIKQFGPRLNIEPYLLFKQTLLVKCENGLLGDGLVTSPGVRVFGKIPRNFDYIAEVVVQRGSFSADRVRAIAQSYVLGWTIPGAHFAPRFSTEYDYASGDTTLKDGLRNTFDQFYPSNHSYYGMIDQFGWKNLKNLRTGFDCLISRKLKLRGDFNEFYLASVQDGLYNSSGSSVVLNRKATSSQIGSSMGGVALYQWTKIWKFGAGYSRFFAGSFLKQSNTAYGYNYPYVTFVGSF